MDQLRFKPRIDDRNDKVAFLLAFSVGAVGILLVRILGADAPLSPFDFLAVVIAVGAIAAYTIYILASTDRSSISLDRAGDNAYYLGLLFTLISLAYSLWKVSKLAIIPSDTPVGAGSPDRVLSLLPDFGLALSSTIAGILARVFVQQFRNDPEDIETQARQELGLAIQQLRSSLLGAVSAMNGATEAADIAIREMTTRAEKTVKESAEANMEPLSRLGHKIDELFSHFSNQIKPASVGMRSLANELEDVISQMKEQAIKLSAASSSTEQDFKTLSLELKNMHQQMQQTRGGYQSFFNELSSFSTKFSSLIPKDIVNQLQSIGSDILERQRQLVAQFDTLKKDIMRLGQRLSAIDNSTSSMTEGSKGQLASQVGEMENDVEQLEQKLRNLLSELKSLQEKTQWISNILGQTSKITKLKRGFFGLFR